jgi:hypothetical protein
VRLAWAGDQASESCHEHDDLKRLLTNPEVFPVELTLTSGDKMKIGHPDYVHFSQKKGQIFIWTDEGGPIFEWIEPQQIAKIRAKAKKSHAA